MGIGGIEKKSKGHRKELTMRLPEKGGWSRGVGRRSKGGDNHKKHLSIGNVLVVRGLKVIIPY